MCSDPPEICSIRRSTPYPCSSPSETAFRINKSNVPGSSSAALPMLHSPKLHRRAYEASPKLSRRRRRDSQHDLSCRRASLEEPMRVGGLIEPEGSMEVQ